MAETEAGWIARKLHESLNGSSADWTAMTESSRTRWVNAVQFLIDSQLIRAAYEKIAFDEVQLDTAKQELIEQAASARVREIVASASINDEAKATVVRELDKTEG